MRRGDISPLRRTFPVPGAPPVRLRLAGPSDRAGVLALLARRGVEAGELEVQRLLAFDPGRRSVLAAFAPLEGRETLVGIGSIENGGDVPGGPGGDRGPAPRARGPGRGAPPGAPRAPGAPPPR